MAETPGAGEHSTSRGPLARHRLWLLLLLLFAGVILAALFWPASTVSVNEEPRPGDVAVAAPIAPPVAAPTTTEEADALPPSVKRYLEATVYPPSTGRLNEAQTDLIHPNQRYEDYRRIPETFSTNPDEIFSVRLTSDHFFYTGDETVHLDLKVKHGSLVIEPLSITAAATREGRGGPEGRAVPIRFRRELDGHVADLDTATFEDHHGAVVVNARIEYQPSVFYDETLRFFFTPNDKIPARFTGEIDDSVVNGSLRIKIGVEVEQSGYYRIDANLYNRFGAPIAFASYKGDLDRGHRFVPIDFFGRLLRDVGAPGPFMVGEIRGYRFLDGEYPDRERMLDLAGRHMTSAYELGVFSDAEYTSEHKTQMVRLLLEDVANGISIDQPPLPTNHSAASAASPGVAPSQQP